MQKRIIYFVRDYKPSSEAVSKEINLLSEFFQNSFIFDLSSKWVLEYNKSLISVPKWFFPLYFLILYFERKGDISHIFSSLGDFPYLRILNKRPIILTGSSAPSSENKILRNLNRLKKLDKIVVECNRYKKMLISLGISHKKIDVIYPGIDLFKYKKPHGRFKVLFLSSPPVMSYFKARGIDLIIKTAKKMPNIQFILVWREEKTTFNAIKKLTRSLNNITVIKGVLSESSIHKLYDECHITIAPFVGFEKNKPCPNSIVESLAHGKPVLITKDVMISDIISKEKCGAVINPTYVEMIDAINILQKKYNFFQKKAQKCARKYFSRNVMLAKYLELYNDLI